MTISRRAALRGLGASGMPALLREPVAQGAEALVVAGQPVELTVPPVGDHIVRISLVPLEAGKPQAIPSTGALVEGKGEAPVLRVTELAEPQRWLAVSRGSACSPARS